MDESIRQRATTTQRTYPLQNRLHSLLRTQWMDVDEYLFFFSLEILFGRTKHSYRVEDSMNTIRFEQ